ncbi:MFS transporter [Nocardioides guangzhouensis]|nr:MFS transporter [Nocardioides guangzhouensis]
MSRRTPLWGYLVAEAVSISGTRLSMIAIPWFVLTSTRSATMTGLVAAAEMAPLVLLQFLSGPFIDRLGARRVALFCDWASALVVGTIPLLHELGLLTIPALVGLVALAGALRGPGDAARHAMLPLLVEHAHLPTERVTGLAGAVERSASLVGAAVAGAVVAAVGGADALVVDAGSFLLSAVVLGITTRGLSPARPEPEEDAHEVASSYVRELRDGWRFMRRDPVLMGIGVMVAVTNLLDQAWSVVLVPVWAKESGYGVAAVGLLAATFGASAVVGSVLAAAWAERLPRYRTYLVAFLMCGAPRFVMLALDAPLWSILLVAVVGGCASGFLNPVLGAVLFERTPPDLMGRVSAMNIAMSWSLIPLGGILGGVAVSTAGLVPALLLVGAAYLVTTMAPAVQPRWKEMDHRPAREPAGEPTSV